MNYDPTPTGSEERDFKREIEESLPVEQQSVVPQYVDNSGREYKYQADWSFGKQMYHIRCDDWKEFLEAKKNIESVLPSEQAFPNDTGPKAVTPEKAIGEVPVCGVHGTPMVLKPAGVSKTGRQYPSFWSCPVRNADQSFCNFRPK